MSPGLVVLGRIYWAVFYLRFLQWVGYILIFQIKDEAKRFPEEVSPLLWTCILCISSCAAKISILIGAHKPLWNNSLGDISLPFYWSQEFLSNFYIRYFSESFPSIFSQKPWKQIQNSSDFKHVSRYRSSFHPYSTTLLSKLWHVCITPIGVEDTPKVGRAQSGFGWCQQVRINQGCDGQRW